MAAAAQRQLDGDDGDAGRGELRRQRHLTQTASDHPRCRAITSWHGIVRATLKVVDWGATARSTAPAHPRGWDHGLIGAAARLRLARPRRALGRAERPARRRRGLPCHLHRLRGWQRRREPERHGDAGRWSRPTKPVDTTTQGLSVVPMPCARGSPNGAFAARERRMSIESQHSVTPAGTRPSNATQPVPAPAASRSAAWTPGSHGRRWQRRGQRSTGSGTDKLAVDLARVARRSELERQQAPGPGERRRRRRCLRRRARLSVTSTCPPAAARALLPGPGDRAPPQRARRGRRRQPADRADARPGRRALRKPACTLPS